VRNHNVVPMRVSDLRLDKQNPRMPDDTFTDDIEAIEFLADVGALEELVQSIATSGWIDFEPLIVLEPTSEVIEGNRRLAALRLIREPELAASLGIKVPSELHENSQPEEVSVWLVGHRRDARDFIGFKHINGAFKWDSFAKAKYAAEWLDDGDGDVSAVARRLGDTHRTVARLVNGYRVLRQAERLGFDRNHIPTRRFAFSHLYTALTRPNYRDYLGLPDGVDLLSENPVTDDRADELTQLMVWLYGQDDTPPVIRSQNPDLKRLAEVLPNRTAVSMLVNEPNLDAAHALVEDKSQIFETAIFALERAANSAIGLVGAYPGGNEDLEDIVGRTAKTVRSIHVAMRATTADAEDDDK
jgi:hypothetical protein